VKKSRKSGKRFSPQRISREDVILEMDDSHLATNPNSLIKEQHEFELDYLVNGKIAHASLMNKPNRTRNFKS
jgi:hypothetical protein